ncbi:MAG: hypothetical protein Q8K75_01035 [Chlamydiales bacterium]|nr:hypothetical protein [Chlamydiales bacterium]
MNQRFLGSANSLMALKSKVARLESMNDQLVAEIQYVDQLLRMSGFECGLETLKQAANELIELDL